MKKHIEPFDYAGQILSAVGKGVLLTAQAGGKVNPMTIGWGTLGIKWGRPVFIVFVRESRFTKSLLDQNPEFTVSVPYGPCDRKILQVCGTKSGRDMDKVAALGLTPEAPEAIHVPGFRELPLTLECRVIYRQPQDPAAIGPEITKRFYPADVPSTASGANRDYHTAYYGEIVAAYLIED